MPGLDTAGSVEDSKAVLSRRPSGFAQPHLKAHAVGNAALELTRCARGDQPTVIDHDYSVDGELGLSQVVRRKEDGRAAAEFARALELQPNQSEALFGQGVLARRSEQAAVAEEKFRATLAANPDHVGALVGLGGFHLQRNELDDAGRLFTRALRLQPDLFPARRSLGNVLMLKGHFDEAVTLFEDGVQRAPQSLEAHFYLGKVYLQRGRFPEAERELEFVARTDLSYREAYVELARLYSLRGEGDRSYIALRQAIGLGFRDFDRVRQDRDFENLLSAPEARDMLAEAERRSPRR